MSGKGRLLRQRCAVETFSFQDHQVRTDLGRTLLAAGTRSQADKNRASVAILVVIHRLGSLRLQSIDPPSTRRIRLVHPEAFARKLRRDGA